MDDQVIITARNSIQRQRTGMRKNLDYHAIARRAIASMDAEDAKETRKRFFKVYDRGIDVSMVWTKKTQ